MLTLQIIPQIFEMSPDNKSGDPEGLLHFWWLVSTNLFLFAGFIINGTIIVSVILFIGFVVFDFFQWVH